MVLFVDFFCNVMSLFESHELYHPPKATDPFGEDSVALLSGSDSPGHDVSF